MQLTVQLPRLLDPSNRTFEAFKQPPLLGPNGDGSSGFHVSLAWSLKKPSPEVEERVRRVLDVKGDRVMMEDGETKFSVAVENIKVKIGNVVNVVDIGAHAGTEEACENRKRRMS